MKRRISTGLGLGVILCVILAGIVWADSMTIVSDTSVMAYGPLTSYAEPGDVAWGAGAPALATWVRGDWPTISGATWISTAYYVEESNEDSWRWFHDELELCTGAYNIDAGAGVAATADNAESFYFNGVFVGQDGVVEGPFVEDWAWGSIINYTIAPVPGLNTLDFIVRNYSGLNSPTGNPTGLLYKLVMTYDCPIEVTIDIKPGSYPNAINLSANGVIPVAVLGSADFDVNDVDPSTILLEGAQLRAKGKSGNCGSIEDVNGDGFDDLVVHVVDFTVAEGAATAVLTGNLWDETPIQGSDSILIVHE